MIFYCLLFGVLFCLYMNIRNDWVYKQRTKLLKHSFNEYLMLPTYNYMFYKFWVWDINKFLKKIDIKDGKNG